MQSKGSFIILILVFSVGFVFAQPSHDPSHMVQENGRNYIYSTGNGIWVMSATQSDFSDWRGEAPVFPIGTYPSWIDTYVDNFGGHFWAPDLIYMNNKWHLYYSCSSFGSQNSAIGLATTSSLEAGNWQDQGMVTYTDGSQGINAIDASLLEDNDGRFWMTYGSYWDGIVITELNPATGKPFDINNITHIANNNPEASSLIEHDGYYYLFFNRGRCCSGVNSTYQMFVGRSTSPTGPFLDKNGVNCNNNGGSTFLHSDGRFVGPGHFGLSGSLFTYHYYDSKNNGNAKLKVENIEWVNDWPVAIYTTESGIANGVYTIRNNHSSNLLELENETFVDGVNATSGISDGNSSERWAITSVNNHYYKITPEAAPDKSLEIINCSNGWGDEVRIWSTINSPCQEWYIVNVSGNSYRLMNKNSYLAMEIKDAITTPGARVQQWPWNQHPTQQWSFTKVGELGVEDISNDSLDMLIYPNPTEGTIKINFAEPYDNLVIEIFTLTGVLVKRAKYSNISQLKLDLPGFNSGIYLIKSKTNNKEAIGKVVLK